MNAVQSIDLRKSYGKTEALAGVDITIETGTVVGLLGPNGAGKTTFVRILATLLRPDSGQAFVGGVDVIEEPHRVRARIGLTGQETAVDDNLTGRENLEHVGRLYHMGGREARRRTAELLDGFGLADVGSKVAKTYSGGMRRRLDIAMSLIARPAVLFLDEPTIGLDPRSRMAMWDFIGNLAHEGTTILLTTQYLEEADQLADRIVVMDRGTVVTEGTSSELKQRLGGGRIEIELQDSADIDKAVEALGLFCAPGCQPQHSNSTVTLPVEDGTQLVPQVVRALDSVGVALIDLGVRQPTLDDVFLSLTGDLTEETLPTEKMSAPKPTQGPSVQDRGVKDS